LQSVMQKDFCLNEAKKIAFAGGPQNANAQAKA
jgi:hypothetical protein